MDVNLNSHAEQSRADSHVKDTRPGATAPIQGEEGWATAVTRWPPVGRPSFLALTNIALCLSFCSLSFPHLYFPPFLKQMETRLGVSLEISCSGFQNGCCVLCTAHNHRCRNEAFSPKPKIRHQDFLEL